MLLYVKHLTLREVGQVMGVTESRVSQIHSGVRKKLRDRLHGHDEVLDCSWTPDLAQAPLEERRARPGCRRARARARRRRRPRRRRSSRRSRSARAEWQQVVAVELVRRASSTSASPASGPCAIATATARLSATTGPRLDGEQPVVGARRSPSPVRRRRRGACSAAIERLQRVRAAAAERERALHQRARPRRSPRASQRARSWSSSSTSSPSASTRASRRESCSSISASRRERLGLVGHQRAQHARRAGSPRRTARAGQRVAGGRRVALGEDRGRASPAPTRSRAGQVLRRAAARSGCRRRASCAWRAASRCAIASSDTRNARATSRRREPPSARSVSATRASGASAGWQQANISRSRSSGIGLSGSSPRRRSQRPRAARGRAALAARARGAGGRSPGCGARDGDPGGRVGRHAVARPALERDHERVLDRLLGAVEVAERAGQRGDRLPRLAPEQAVDD